MIRPRRERIRLVRCVKCGNNYYTKTNNKYQVKMKCAYCKKLAVHKIQMEKETEAEKEFKEKIFTSVFAKELKDFMTSGWSPHEKKQFKQYLEGEIKPYYPNLYIFLKKWC